MAHWVVERYLAGGVGAAARDDAERIRRAANDLARTRFVQSVYLPGDELCLYLFEGGSEAEVADVARVAEVDVDRIRAAEIDA
jgi:hypothetical protein